MPEPIKHRWWNRYRELLPIHRSELEAARRVVGEMRQQDPENHRRLDMECQRATYERRHYGNGKFFCWVAHPDIEHPGDPWEAATFPKSVLRMMLCQSYGL